MQRWILDAFLSMIFAGVTSVIAKKGLTNVSGDVGVTIRTCFVFVLTWIFALAVIPHKDWAAVKTSNVVWLGLSAVTTTLSWIFYYRAVKAGEVSTVALIDKGSVVVAVLLAIIVLHESLTPFKIFGAGLIVAGLFAIARG